MGLTDLGQYTQQNLIVDFYDWRQIDYIPSESLEIITLEGLLNRI